METKQKKKRTFGYDEADLIEQEAKSKFKDDQRKIILAVQRLIGMPEKLNTIESRP